tara:strand:- start:9568 stop:9921 length:354 start_codon:yes stop_codon:yes gene_type:complete
MRVIKIDGNCNLCNGFIRLIYNSNPIGFYYAMFEENEEKNSVHYFRDNTVYYGAMAIIEILRDTDKIPLKIVARLLSIMPSTFVLYVYRFIAQRRYVFFGKKDSCSITDQIPKKYRV